MKYFKTPSLKYFMKFLIFVIKWLKTFKNMIKVYEVSRKYIMLFMNNNRYFNWFTYFVAVNYTACTHSPSWNISEIFHEIFHEIFLAKKFHEILHHYMWCFYAYTDQLIFWHRTLSCAFHPPCFELFVRQTGSIVAYSVPRAS